MTPDEVVDDGAPEQVPWIRRGWRAKSLWIVGIIVLGHIIVVPLTAALIAWFVNR